MASPQTNLRVRISADLADIKSGLATLQRDLAGVKRSAATSLGDNNAFVNGLRRARQELAAIAGTYLSLQGLQTFARLSDQAAQLQGRLRLATRSQAEFNKAQRDTFDIAQRNQVSLETSVDLYGRLGRATRNLGLGQSIQADLTETILQAGRLSFASEQGLDAAIVQLGQGLSSGTLRGEELNSVLEQTPRLGQAIQDGLVELGVKGAENLRKLAKEGQLTPDLIVRAILTQQAKLQAESANLPDTIAGSFTRLSNALLKFINDSNQANSAAQTIIQFLKAVADNLPVIASLLLLGTKLVVAYFLAFRAGPAAIGLATGALTLYKNQVIATNLAQTLGIKTAGTWAGRLKTAAATVAAAFIGWEVGTYLKDEFLEVELAGIALVSGLLTGFERLKLAATILGLGIKSAIAGALNFVRDNTAKGLENFANLAEGADFFGFNAGAVAKARKAADQIRSTGSAYTDFKREAREAAAASKRTVDQILADTDALAKAAIEKKLLGGEEDPAEGVVTPPTTPTGGGRAAANNLALLRDAVDRSIRELQRMYDAGEISMRAFFDKKAQLETEAVDLAIRQAQEELRVAETTEQQSAILTDIVKLQRDRAEIGPRAAREQAAAEADLANKLRDVSVRLLELNGNAEAAATVKLVEQFRELRAQLEKEGNKAGLAIVDAVFNKELIGARLQAFQGQMQAAIGALRTTETSVGAQSEAGAIGAAEAEKQIDAARTSSLATLQALRQSVAAYYAETKDPSVLQFLQELDGNIAQVAASQQKFRQQVQDQAINSVTNLFTDLATGAKSAKDALRDFVLGFVQGMAQIAARALATFLVLKLLDAIYPGLGKATAASMNVGVGHGGGIAGRLGIRREGVSPLLFGNAPRYHGGGIAGLAPDEVPAILRRGEEVITETDPRHRDNGGRGGAGGRVTTPIVAIGDDAVANAMAGVAGEDVVLTHVRNNWEGLMRG